MENEIICTYCGNNDNFHHNYDYSKKDLPVEEILCNECGKFFDNLTIEKIASVEFERNLTDEGLFPNHTDKDIWVKGFKAGVEWCK